MIDAPHTGTVVQVNHFVDGPGVNRIIGYGRMRGASKSNTANPYTDNNRGKGDGGPVAVDGVIGAISSIVVWGAVIILVLLAFAAIAGAGLLIGGST